MKFFHNRRAFTLTEMAIVLGVAGIVLGAIWSAASMVNRNLRLNKAQEQIMSIFNNVKLLYDGRKMRIDGSTYRIITTALISANGFPREMVFGNTVKNDWGGTVDIKLSPVASRYFYIIWRGVNSKDCAALADAIMVPNGNASNFCLDNCVYNVTLSNYDPSVIAQKCKENSDPMTFRFYLDGTSE